MKQRFSNRLRVCILLLGGGVMLYPLLWMLGATFMTNAELFGSFSPIPTHPTLDGYRLVMEQYGGAINLLGAMKNTLFLILPKVLFTLISCTLTAYGFARFEFRGKRILFALLISTLFLPQSVMYVPQFLMFSELGWVDSPFYLALVLPSLFAFDTYFIFMLIQHFKSTPRELDDAAKIDGCNAVQTLLHVLCPVIRPALISCALLQFIWSSNDYMGPLLYVNTPEYYPLSLFVKLSMDADTGAAWNRILAVSLISVLPTLVLFFSAQKFFVEDITAGSLKS